MKTIQLTAYWLRFSVLLVLFGSAFPLDATAQQCTNYFATPVVNAIAIDAQGNKWFGTSTGMWKFDGTNYTRYLPSNSGLTSSAIIALAIDAQGNKWAVTYNSGIFKFDGTTWTAYNTSNSGLASNYVSNVVIDAQGNKWFGHGTYGNGISKFDGTTWTTYNTSNSGLTDNAVKAIAIDAQGNKWIATNNGVSKFDGTLWTTYNTANSGLTNNAVKAIAIDAQGNKWFGTGNGVSKLEGTNWTTYNTSNSGLTNYAVDVVTIDAQGNKWFGGNSGVSKWNGTTWTKYNTYEGLVNDDVYAIAIDAQGNKWFGTKMGASQFDNTNWTTHKVSNSGLAANTILTVAIDAQGNKWVGTNAGVSKFDGTNWTTYNTSNSTLVANDVSCITFDAQGNKWFGTSVGVSKFDGTNWTTYDARYTYYTPGNVRCLASDAQGIWAGTSNHGVFRFNGSSWENYDPSSNIPTGLPSSNISAMTIDAQGNKWFAFGANQNGVSKFNGYVWENYTNSNPNQTDYVYVIAVDAQGKKWFGLSGQSLTQFDGVNWNNYYTNELDASSISGIAIDAQGNKWLATSDGLNQVQLDATLFSAHWTHYNLSNSGLASNTTTAIAIDAQGNKWVGTANGLSKFSFCTLSAAITRNGTTLTAMPTGGTAPFTYLWNNQSTSATLQNMTSGVYEVTITDALGCTATASFSNCQVTGVQNRTLQQGYSVTVNGHVYSTTGTYRDTIFRSGLCDSILVTNLTVVNCGLAANITRSNNNLTANPTNGRAPYTYHWNNQAITATLSNVSVGSYAVTITDSLGCTATASFTVAAQPVSSQLYQLQVTDAQCGGAQPATLHINMNTQRNCMDALMLKVQFDTTKVYFEPNMTIQKGTAIDSSGRVFYSIRKDTLFITVDLETGCIQGDSSTNVLKIPFRLRPAFAVPRATSAFNLKVLEERIVSGTTRDNANKSFEVSSPLVAKIQVFRPNGNALTGTTKPITFFAGDTCTLLNRPIVADNNANAFVRLDSFRYFRIHRAPPTIGSPLIGGYDVFLLRNYLHGNQVLTPRQKMAADVNNDGLITTLDVTILRRRAVGIYTNFSDYSGGRLTSDYQFVLQNSDTPQTCFRVPNLATTCDTPNLNINMITLGDLNGDTDTTTLAGGIRLQNNNLMVQFCRATRVANEWKIPVFADAITRGLDLQLLNIPDADILRVESAHPADFEVSANGKGIGNNYYIIGFANNLQGIAANDTLLYLYVKTAQLSQQHLGNLNGYLDAQWVNTQTLVCTPTSDLYTNPYEVYPNPTTGMVQMTTQQPLTEPTTLRIYDLLGRCVKTQVLQRGNDHFAIDMADLANSVYQFHFANQYKKVVKQ
ncbi:MAG: hypothetical protein RLZZ628_1599 [Bacteroidota bacterium]